LRTSLIVVALLALSAAVSCYVHDWSDGASPVLRDNESDDDEAAGVWTDSSTGLMWPVEASMVYEWDEAGVYCKNLSFGGYDDWRLPTVSELRSLIRGCNATATDGDCGVTDSCLAFNCMSDSCGGCTEYEGPAEGKYWPPDLAGVCCSYWTSSPVSDNDEMAWGVDFHSAAVHWVILPSGGLTRCVRP
jgi:hypothetical protein